MFMRQLETLIDNLKVRQRLRVKSCLTEKNISHSKDVVSVYQRRTCVERRHTVQDRRNMSFTFLAYKEAEQ